MNLADPTEFVLITWGETSVTTEQDSHCLMSCICQSSAVDASIWCVYGIYMASTWPLYGVYMVSPWLSS